ncbi:Hypothetical predicted protein [Podarcis lilfordi]|uniref:Uncharacterized protein n=1 Tax=Podarcis lilfordi TaxID=74358 RepID=A0AA35KGM1_9SAUR|nr:Hypothetical predicted protein [Podarcis lilfordi]
MRASSGWTEGFLHSAVYRVRRLERTRYKTCREHRGPENMFPLSFDPGKEQLVKDRKKSGHTEQPMRK